MDMEEIWKDITGYEGRYQVSNLGRVKSLGKNGSPGEFIMKNQKKKTGYEIIGLRFGKERKFFPVHRLVAREFCDGYGEGLVVMHLNNIKDDNRAENLKWGTHKENTQQAVRDGLIVGYGKIEIDRDKLYQEYIVNNRSLNECAGIFDVTYRAVVRNLGRYKIRKYKKNK